MAPLGHVRGNMETEAENRPLLALAEGAASRGKASGDAAVTPEEHHFMVETITRKVRHVSLRDRNRDDDGKRIGRHPHSRKFILPRRV